MKVVYDNKELNLTFSEFGHVFALYDDEGEMFDRLDPAGYFGKVQPNQAWISEMYMDLLTSNKVVEKTDTSEECADGMMAFLVDIIHPEFHDEGYSQFGDFSRERLGQQCQYGSRYITGKLDNYPALGEGLRFKNLDRGDYHSIRIHRDDMDEFERRYKAYRDHVVNGVTTLFAKPNFN
jgi:hypothetical protein